MAHRERRLSSNSAGRALLVVDRLAQYPFDARADLAVAGVESALQELEI
jgi:hypothetical protein